MMASPLIKVPSTAAALDWTAKTSILAETSVDLLSPDIFSEMVAYFGNEAIAGLSVNAIPLEKEPASDGTAPINNRVNFPLGDSIDAQLLIDMASSRVSLSGADAGVAPVFPLRGEPADLMAITRLLPFAIGDALSKHEASNDIQLSAPQIGGDIAPTSEVTLATFLANLHDFISDLLPKDELGGPLNIADLHKARDGQDAVLGIMVSEQGAVLTQTLPSAPQLVEGTLTSVLPLGDEKLTLNDSLLTARDGQDAVLGIMVSKQGAVLTQTLPSAPQLVEGILTSALPLSDKKLTLNDNKIPVDTTLKNIGAFTKWSIEDLPVMPAKMVALVGATPLPEKAVSQAVAPAIPRDNGLQAAASDALPNTGPEVEVGLGKKQSTFADPTAMAMQQAATPPSISTQPVMSDLIRLVAISPEREAPSVSNASVLEAVAAISGVDTAPGGAGGQSQGGNAQTGTGTNSQQGMAQSQALATVLDVQRQGWTKALVGRAMSMVQSGGTMTFKVMPAHLGMITLKLSEGRRGTDLRIVADVAATASMLRDVKHQISAAFESAGITLGEYSAGTSDRGDKGSASRNYDRTEDEIEPKIQLNQNIKEIPDYSSNDHSSINIIL
jgi:hypothetical protein